MITTSHATMRVRGILAATVLATGLLGAGLAASPTAQARSGNDATPSHVAVGTYFEPIGCNHRPCQM
jgi:hypothetical protein